MSPPDSIQLAAKLESFQEHWSPKVVAELNDNQIKLVKLLGEFVWHQHDDTDELFLVLDGEMKIEFRSSKESTSTVTRSLRTGELLVVPQGMQHRPIAEQECHVLLIEPRGVINTGEAGGPLTAPSDEWI